jgi:hypothetical protein
MMTQIVNGHEVEVPLVTQKKMFNHDTGRVEVVMILRTVPNLKARQWAIDTLSKLIIAPMTKETNVNLNMTKHEVARIDEASTIVKNNPKLKEKLLEMIYSGELDDKAIDADFEEIEDS